MNISNFMQEWQAFLVLLEWANSHGIWNVAQFLILGCSFIIGLKIIYFPKRRIRNLNFHARIARNERQKYHLFVNLELRNYTGRTVVLSSPFFKYIDLHPPMEAPGDSPSGEYEIKFPNEKNKNLTEVEYMLRNKESVHTIIPLDPSLTDERVQRAHKRRRIGRLTMTCTWLQDRPKVQKLVRRV